MHVNAYGMPKQKAGIIIDTFEGKRWIGALLRCRRSGKEFTRISPEESFGRSFNSTSRYYFPLTDSPPLHKTNPRLPHAARNDLVNTEWEDVLQTAQGNKQNTQEERAANRTDESMQ